MVLHLHYVNDKYVKLSRLSETLVLEMFNFFLLKKDIKTVILFLVIFLSEKYKYYIDHILKVKFLKYNEILHNK